MIVPKTVHIVHAVDTEGPLYESLQATFERVLDTFDVRVQPTYENLEKLRRKEICLAGKEEIIAKFLDPRLLRYEDSWEKIDLMLSVVMDRGFRNRLPDSFGNGWVYNWHCMDHVGYELNPRGRDMGYHNIHDRYIEFLDKYDSSDIDTIQWHFHPMSFYREANRSGTSYENSVHLHQCLCRRIIERDFFPSVFRAGIQTERPDSHWFLEQWIPFDCSNLAVDNEDDLTELELQNDSKDGRFADWRRAPADWSVYQPDHDDYQVAGRCRRYIARFLNFDARFASITQAECDKAFRHADQGTGVILGLCNHDFRDIGREVEKARDFIRHSAQKWPHVPFRYVTAQEAFNAVVHDGKHETLDLAVELCSEGDVLKLRVETKRSKVFGPQPYLAIKTRSGKFVHDNFDFGLDGRTWHYVFDAESVRSTDLEAVGVAANNEFGDTFIKNHVISG